jgi:hypothetical protein
MTNISPFISEANYNIEAEALFAKFKVACTSFLRAMASGQHPVVVFLDYVQWDGNHAISHFDGRSGVCI